MVSWTWCLRLSSFGFAPAEVEVAYALLVADANGHAIIVPDVAVKLFLYAGLNADLVPRGQWCCSWSRSWNRGCSRRRSCSRVWSGSWRRSWGSVVEWPRSSALFSRTSGDMSEFINATSYLQSFDYECSPAADADVRTAPEGLLGAAAQFALLIVDAVLRRVLRRLRSDAPTDEKKAKPLSHFSILIFCNI